MLLLLLIATAPVVALAQPPPEAAGITASLSTAGLNFVLDALLPVIEADLDHIGIPDINGQQDGFDYSLNNIACGSFAVGSSVVSTSNATGIDIALAGIALQCSASWSFKLDSWPHVPSGSGSADVAVSGTSAAVGALVSAAAGHAQVAVTSSTLTVGSIDISFHGSLWDWLLNLLKGLIEDAVKKAVAGAFTDAVDSLVAKTINPKLAAIAMEIPLNVRAPYNISEVRFGLVSQPVFTPTYLGVGLQGDVVPLADPVSPPGLTPPALPPFNQAAASSFIQVTLSSYTLLSAVATYFSANLTDWTIGPGQLPLGLNNTDAYGLIAPGLPLAYPDSAVSVEFSFSAMPTLAFAGAGLNISLPVLITWEADAHNGSLARPFALLAQTELAGTLSFGPDSNGSLALLGDVAFLSAALSVVDTAVGPVSVGLLQALVDVVFSSVVLPLINAIFANGIPIPTVDGLSLTGTELLWGPGYLTLGSNFTYNATA